MAVIFSSKNDVVLYILKNMHVHNSQIFHILMVANVPGFNGSIDIVLRYQLPCLHRLTRTFDWGMRNGSFVMNQAIISLMGFGTNLFLQSFFLGSRELRTNLSFLRMFIPSPACLHRKVKRIQNTKEI